MNTTRFPNIIGQESAQQKLIELVSKNRLSHAILLVGNEGTGVLPLAVGFAQYVVSFPQSRKAPVMVTDLFGGLSALPADEEGDSPGGGESFPGFDAKALDFVHPDLHFSFPVFKKDPNSTSPPISADFASEWRTFLKTNPYGNLYDWLQFIKAENKQGNISARECNEIAHKLSLKSFESRYKVLVMWIPEMLGPAGNKLLKLIEEPPPDTLFILAAHEEHKVLQTIHSRCQVIKIPPLAASEISAALMEKKEIERDVAEKIALVSNGSYREATELLVHHEDNWNALLREWLNATLMRGTGNLYANQNKMVSDLAALGREKQKQLLLYFLQLIEQGMRLRLMGPENVKLPDQEAEFAQRLNKIAGPSTLAVMAKLLEDACYYIERNANTKLLFHGLSIKLRYAILEKIETGVLS